MQNKRGYQFLTVMVNVLTLAFFVSPLRAANQMILEQTNVSPQFTQNENRVDARTLREWRDELKNNPKFDLNKISHNVQRILKEKDEQLSYFESVESFIPADPKLQIRVDSNVHFEDITALVRDLANYSENSAKRGDLLRCQNALILIPDVVLSPINLIPPDEVMYAGQKKPGDELYSFVWLPAYFGALYLESALPEIQSSVRNPKAFDHIFENFKELNKLLKDNLEKMQILVDQSKKNDPKINQLSRERKDILLKFMESFKPQFMAAFKSASVDSVDEKTQVK